MILGILRIGCKDFYYTWYTYGASSRDGKGINFICNKFGSKRKNIILLTTLKKSEQIVPQRYFVKHIFTDI